MRKLIFLFTTVLFSSCFTYQYMTVDSAQLPKDDGRSFVMENDTLKLTYSFHGGGGALTITVFNKTSQPMFINWNRSALICNDQSYSLSQNNSSFVASSVRTGYGMADLSGTVNVNPALEVIPAQTKVSRTPFNLNISLPRFKMLLPDSSSKQFVDLPDGARLAYRGAIVDETRSPLRMKSYLTFLVGPGNGTEFTESHTFYVAKVRQTRYGPDQFLQSQVTGDQFFIVWPQH